jgi:thioredoxin 1
MPSTTATLPEVTDATFAAEVLAADRPVLVKFTAEWCGWCRMMEPVLVALQEELGDELSIVSLDADHNPETTSSLAVLSLPTLMLFRAGEPVASLVGAMPKARLRQRIVDALPPAD